MLQPLTLKIFAALVGALVLLAAPAYLGPSVLMPLAAAVAIVPVMSIYVFHAIGVPGLLEHQGRCGWGLCNPSAFGFVFLVAFWLVFFWLVAWGIAYLAGRR